MEVIGRVVRAVNRVVSDVKRGYLQQTKFGREAFQQIYLLTAI